VTGSQRPENLRRQIVLVAFTVEADNWDSAQRLVDGTISVGDQQVSEPSWINGADRIEEWSTQDGDWYQRVLEALASGGLDIFDLQELEDKVNEARARRRSTEVSS
jgi:hypothetical protein